MAKRKDLWDRIMRDLGRHDRRQPQGVPSYDEFLKQAQEGWNEYFRRHGKWEFENQNGWPRFDPLTEDSYNVGSNSYPGADGQKMKASNTFQFHEPERATAVKLYKMLNHFYNGTNMEVIDITGDLRWTHTVSAKISKWPEDKWIRDLRPINSRPRWHTMDVDYD